MQAAKLATRCFHQEERKKKIERLAFTGVETGLLNRILGNGEEMGFGEEGCVRGEVALILEFREAASEDFVQENSMER